MTQAMQALARANEIRSARSLILRPLRRGDLVIAEVDFDAPELQSMRLVDLLASLRYKRIAGSYRHPALDEGYKAPSTRRAQMILNRTQINGSKRIGELTARQRQVLVATVEASSAAQRRAR